jgi:thiol:disulfide interchange protein DsbA
MLKKLCLQLLSACAAACLLAQPAHSASYFDNALVDDVVNPGRLQTKGDIEVVEFFWYGCHSCAAFEPQLNAWVATLPRNVHFMRLPASWNPDMVAQQRLYFTLLELKRLDLHAKVFADIHTKRRQLDTPARIAAWAGEQKINANTWRDTFNSAAVTAQVAAAQSAYQRFELNWVPALVIDGRRVVAYTPSVLNDADQEVRNLLSQNAPASSQIFEPKATK